MNIGVRYLAQLRQRAGRATDSVQVPAPCTVAGLILILAQRDENLRSVLLDATGQPQPTLLVFVGDIQASRDRLLNDDDEVTLMTPIAGGSQC